MYYSTHNTIYIILEYIIVIVFNNYKTSSVQVQHVLAEKKRARFRKSTTKVRLSQLETDILTVALHSLIADGWTFITNYTQIIALKSYHCTFNNLENNN